VKVNLGGRSGFRRSSKNFNFYIKTDKSKEIKLLKAHLKIKKGEY